jgi:hypothetical protein
MELFLWRGERRYGKLYLRENIEGDALGSVRAVLLPDGDTVGLEGVYQRRHSLFPGAPVTQRRRDPFIMAERHVSRANRRNRPPVPPTIRDGKPIGVQTDLQYTVRDEADQPLPFESIGILEVRPIPGEEDKTLGDLPRFVLHHGSIWTVFATRVAAG